jgi:hypothetical protein
MRSFNTEFGYQLSTNLIQMAGRRISRKPTQQSGVQTRMLAKFTPPSLPPPPLEVVPLLGEKRMRYLY